MVLEHRGGGHLPFWTSNCSANWAMPTGTVAVAAAVRLSATANSFQRRRRRGRPPRSGPARPAAAPPAGTPATGVQPSTRAASSSSGGMSRKKRHHQPDRHRQVDRDVGEDQRGQGVVKPDAAGTSGTTARPASAIGTVWKISVQPRKLARDPLAPAQPRQRIGGEGADDQHEDGADGGDDQAVLDVAEEVRAAAEQHVPVVVRASARTGIAPA